MTLGIIKVLEFLSQTTQEENRPWWPSGLERVSNSVDAHSKTQVGIPLEEINMDKLIRLLMHHYKSSPPVYK